MGHISKVYAFFLFQWNYSKFCQNIPHSSRNKSYVSEFWFISFFGIFGPFLVKIWEKANFCPKIDLKRSKNPKKWNESKFWNVTLLKTPMGYILAKFGQISSKHKKMHKLLHIFQSTDFRRKIKFFFEKNRIFW